MSTILAWIGGIFCVLWLLGAMGIGDFHMYYGPDAKSWHREQVDAYKKGPGTESSGPK